MIQLEEYDYMIPAGELDQLHIKRFNLYPDGRPVLLLHGSVESGRIFYSLNQKGFGPYLARQGYDVFIPDLRGRGQSTPPVGRNMTHSNAEVILEDMPAILSFIRKLKGDVPMHWGAHSWGGIQMLCYLARFPETQIHSMVFFAAVRRKMVRNLQRLLKFNLGYGVVMSLVAPLYGYLPARQWGFGSDNESLTHFRETRAWIMKEEWKSFRDGFDYAKEIPKTHLPPTLYLAGAGDIFMGHASDIRREMIERGQENEPFRILGKANGNLHDYGHNDMLFHRDAAEDHFQEIVEWMRKFE